MGAVHRLTTQVAGQVNVTGTTWAAQAGPVGSVTVHPGMPGAQVTVEACIAMLQRYPA